MREFDVAYFAASCDTPDTNQAFAESLQLDYPILSDPEKQVASAYGVLHESGNFARRWTFYIDREGVIRYIDRQVTPATHGEAIAEKLAELGFPRKH